MSDLQRRDWDDAAAEEAVANFNKIAGVLESLISAREADVRTAMSDYFADGVSAEYQAKEQRWAAAASEVRGIIAALRGSLESSQQIAGEALNKAKQAVAALG